MTDFYRKRRMIKKTNKNNNINDRLRKRNCTACNLYTCSCFKSCLLQQPMTLNTETVKITPIYVQVCNTHDNLQQDLADRRMANPMDSVLGHYTSLERQPPLVPELSNNQPHQPSKQSQNEDHTEQVEVVCLLVF